MIFNFKSDMKWYQKTKEIRLYDTCVLIYEKVKISNNNWRILIYLQKTSNRFYFLFLLTD